MNCAGFTYAVLRKTFGLLSSLPDYPQHRPFIRFLFVTTHFCFELPSDSTSRWTPLPFANSSSSSRPVRDLRPISNVCAWHTKSPSKPKAIRTSFLFFFTLTRGHVPARLECLSILRARRGLTEVVPARAPCYFAKQTLPNSSIPTSSILKLNIFDRQLITA